MFFATNPWSPRPQPRPPRTGVAAAALPMSVALLAALFLGGCGGDEQRSVVVYCALDQEHSSKIVDLFEERTGIRVEALYDTELTKTVGLRTRIQEERDHPRCDVFWNNEIVNTVMLQQDGLLEPYDSPAAADIPSGFRDADHYWTGFAARGRIFIVNTEKTPEADWPRSYRDMLDPARAGQWCMAKPLTGTTASHVAVWFDELGADETKAMLLAAKANGLNLLTSNGMTMRQVRNGEIPYGWTDTDDYNVARVNGYPVDLVYPDQGEDESGCLVIPNTIAMIANGPNPEEAKAFIDFVLSREVEEMLAHSDSAQIPVRADVPVPDNVTPLSEIRVMEVDFTKAASDFETVGRWVKDELLAED